MSTLFWDGIVDFSGVKVLIQETGYSGMDREELDKLVDATITPKIMEKILDDIPEERHEDFLVVFSEKLHDRDAIFGFIAEVKGIKGEEVEEMMKGKLEGIKDGLLQGLRPRDEITAETGVSKR